MSFGNNTTLVTTANFVDMAPDSTNGESTGTAGADTYSFHNNSGDESINTFGKNDSIVNYQKIFDGNNDGIIDFGPNGVLDIDRTSSKQAGADQITLIGMESKQLRYLGTKDNVQFVYADASVKLAGFIEGTVGNDSMTASGGAKTYFYDTALGLNLGQDTIKGFGADDLIVTTSEIHNASAGPAAGAAITFGANGVLDLPGQVTPAAGDNGDALGGQISLAGVSALYEVDHKTIGGVDYYYYANHPAPAV